MVSWLVVGPRVHGRQAGRKQQAGATRKGNPSCALAMLLVLPELLMSSHRSPSLAAPARSSQPMCSKGRELRALVLTCHVSDRCDVSAPSTHAA